MDDIINVKVAVRVRPLSTKELNRNCQTIINVVDSSIHVKALDNQRIERQFAFDYCYDSNSLQENVYNDLGKPLIVKALDGFNGTIFAYGQTGSGKSHSMTGSSEDKGIIPRLNADLWQIINNKLTDSEADVKYLITVSFLEIYNEVLKDLLNPSEKPLKIRESPDNGIYVEGLCELVVRDSADVQRLIDQGNTVRRVAATNMNEQSSRSHSCFTIKIERKTTTNLIGGVTREQICKAKLNLVDLAGSERATKTGATGATLKEGIGINSSLMALGNVINALAEGGKRHIPYRDSKLTRLLQESLGGNSATVMIAAVSPADYNYDETVSTLKYANRAKSIANNVVRNEDLSERVIRDLKGQIEQLKAQLASSGGASANPELEAQLLQMQRQQQSAWEEKEKLSKQLEEERSKNMNSIISTMMDSIKSQKLEHIKNIKRLTNEKNIRLKTFKDEKETNSRLSTDLDEKMKKYQTLQLSYDTLSKQLIESADSKNDEDPERELIVKSQAEKLASDMSTLLINIEKDRNDWLKRREALLQLKENLTVIDEKITDEKAELVAFTGLLDENNKIRSQIQDEEREKARLLIDKEISEAKEKLVKEMENVRGTIEEELAGQMNHLKMQVAEKHSQYMNEKQINEDLVVKLNELRVYSDSLEIRLADAEVEMEASDLEIEKLTIELEKLENLKIVNKELENQLVNEKQKNEELVRKLQEDNVKLQQSDKEHTLKVLEEEKYILFKTLMNEFEEERKVMQDRLVDSERHLTSCIKDIMYLSRKNEELKQQLQQSLLWEPGLKPS